MTAFNLIKSLKKRGNVLLGSGCYAAAISSANSEQIIKIGNSTTDPWLDYYHIIVKTNQNNPHVPKVQSFMCDEEYNYYVCVMEKLENNASNYKTDAVELCKDYTTRLITYEEFIVHAKRFKKAIPNPDMLANLLDKIYEYTEVFTYDYGYEFSENARRLDMHKGNFLFRGDLLVVTDPWCENDMSDIVEVDAWVNRMSSKTTSVS